MAFKYLQLTSSQLCGLVAASLTLAAFPALSELPQKPVPVPKLNASESKLTNLLTIQLEFEETQYLKSKSDRSYKKIISLREKLIQLTCMPQLRLTLAHNPKDNSTQCQAHLDWMKKVIPDNPVALCAELGTTSPGCSAAFDSQYIGTMDSSQLRDLGLEAMDLELRLADLRKKGTTDTKSLMSKVYNLGAKLKKKPSPELREDFEEIAKKYIQESCASSAVVYLDEQPAEHLKAVQVSNDSNLEKDATKKLIKEFEDTLTERKRLKDDALKQVEEFQQKRELAEKLDPATFDTSVTPTPTPVERVFYRMRYISRDCESALETVDKTTHSLPHSVCAREGFLAPRCLSAVAAYRKRSASKKSQKAPTTGSINQQGLGTF